ASPFPHRPPPIPPLFPYTTLFRSVDHHFVPILECRIHAQTIHRERYEQELSDYQYEDHRNHYRNEPFFYLFQHNATPLFIHFSRSEEHTSELQSRFDLVCRLLLEK